MPITISVIKADIGGFPGHSGMHQALLETAKKELKKTKLLTDFYVTHCGDDLDLIMSHKHGEDSEKIHKLAWDVFLRCTKKAKELKLYGAGQDILSEAFSGNVKGMGPGVAELEFEERKSEPLVIFMADKTEPGAWNFPMYKIFADPFNTAGLVIDPSMHEGFKFEVHDVFEGKKVTLAAPEESYDLLALIGQPARYCIKYIFKKDGTPVASLSTQRLSVLAGRYVGKDDPVAIVRSQSGIPALGEILEPFAFPYSVAGWMRGSHHGPLMPVSMADARCTRFDGPPRVVGLGFQVCNGKLIGPTDLFGDPAFDRARQKANEIADYIRRHGPFEPHRLSAEEMEYTTLPKVIKKLQNRFKKIG
jgi:fructose 1,6-bisphosphate aldolase/phosphatase